MSDLGQSPGSTEGSHQIVLAHGFTQTARSWSGIEQLLHGHMPDIETLAIDMPGHASASELRGDLWASADHLTQLGGEATYIGYSMGGRVGLHAALARPDLVRALVLIGATAGIDSHEERQLRRTADEQLADRIESIGVPAFIDEWLTNPLFASLTDDQSQRTDRLRNTAEGLAASLRSAGTGTQDNLWVRLSEVEVPVLVIAGEHDAKFQAIGRRLADELPHSTFEVIAEAGHSVHLEQPEATVDAIGRWYKSLNFS